MAQPDTRANAGIMLAVLRSRVPGVVHLRRSARKVTMSVHKIGKLSIKLPDDESAVSLEIKRTLSEELPEFDVEYVVVKGCEPEAIGVELPGPPTLFQIIEKAEGTCKKVPTSSPGALIEAQGIISRVLNRE